MERWISRERDREMGVEHFSMHFTICWGGRNLLCLSRLGTLTDPLKNYSTQLLSLTVTPGSALVHNGF
jgi:hypothetical protein